MCQAEWPVDNLTCWAEWRVDTPTDCSKTNADSCCWELSAVQLGRAADSWERYRQSPADHRQLRLQNHCRPAPTRSEQVADFPSQSSCRKHWNARKSCRSRWAMRSYLAS